MKRGKPQSVATSDEMHIKIKDDLKRLGLTQKEVAEIFNTTQENVSFALGGSKSAALRHQIAHWLVEKKGFDEKRYFNDDSEELLQNYNAIQKQIAKLAEMVGKLSKKVEDIDNKISGGNEPPAS